MARAASAACLVWICTKTSPIVMTACFLVRPVRTGSEGVFDGNGFESGLLTVLQALMAVVQSYREASLMQQYGTGPRTPTHMA